MESKRKAKRDRRQIRNVKREHTHRGLDLDAAFKALLLFCSTPLYLFYMCFYMTGRGETNPNGTGLSQPCQHNPPTDENQWRIEQNNSHAEHNGD